MVNADFLVIGAGAMGMAFCDTLTSHANVRVALVDRRYGVGGHWLAAYPFVRLHQASAFYGVPSTLLGDGGMQQRGPETGLQERATQAEICSYYADALDRLEQSESVSFFPLCDYLGRSAFTSRISGERFIVGPHCRIVDARYLAPSIPSEKPAPFDVGSGVTAIPVNDVVFQECAPRQYVVVGSGKTATDACIWLLGHGVAPDHICWVRPRDPWMFNRAAIQPDPAIFLAASADIMESAESAASIGDLFLNLEERGVLLRIDPSVVPTMAKTPTLATWELDLLRTIDNVVRRGHLRLVERGRLHFDDATVAITPNAVVVHCAADGLKYPPLVPIWQPHAITLQAVRAGFPLFGAAAAGYLEATRRADDDKNRLCQPAPYGDSLREWATMTVTGSRNAMRLLAEPDVREWSMTVALNPARIPPGHPGSPALDQAQARLAKHTTAGLTRLDTLRLPA